MSTKTQSLLVVILLMAVLSGSIVDQPVQAVSPGDVTFTIELSEVASCPFLFTWDGEAWQIENDLYSVGRGAGNEYTDYLALKNAVEPQAGKYCFEMREVPTEESWTDMLKLITIDHPAGLSAGVDSQGNAHTYGEPVSPMAAVDGGGGDVKAEVQARDEAGVDLYEGDLVTLDFTGVDIATAAKLVLGVDGFEGDAAGVPTGKVPAIKIQTLESGSWVTRHTFYPKEYWAEGVFDLKPYLGESMSVRLVGESCDQGKYQVLDYAGLDTTADDLSASVLEPVSAVLNGETDVLGQVSGSDDVYVHTVKDDVVVVCFTAEPLVEGERSFGFVSEGYYKRAGNSYYIDIWNGATWVQTITLTTGAVMISDTFMTASITGILPDTSGEYKFRVRNVISSAWGAEMAEVDFVGITVGDIDGVIQYAYDSEKQDILRLVIDSDDVRWNAMNKWAVIGFYVYGNRSYLPVIKKPPVY